MSGGMKFDDDGFNAVADCISRGVHLTLQVGERVESVSRCDRCQNLSQAVFRMKGIAEDAVYDLGTATACAVCDTGGDE